MTYLLDISLVGGTCRGDHVCLKVHLGQLNHHVADAASSAMHQHPRARLQIARLQGLQCITLQSTSTRSGCRCASRCASRRGHSNFIHGSGKCTLRNISAKQEHADSLALALVEGCARRSSQVSTASQKRSPLQDLPASRSVRPRERRQGC